MFLTRYLTSLKSYYIHANIGINFDLKLPYSNNVSLRFFLNSCVHDDVVACMLLLLCSHCMGFWILSFRFILKLLRWNNIFLLHGSSLFLFLFFHWVEAYIIIACTKDFRFVSCNDFLIVNKTLIFQYMQMSIVDLVFNLKFLVLFMFNCMYHYKICCDAHG